MCQARICQQPNPCPRYLSRPTKTNSRLADYVDAQTRRDRGWHALGPAWALNTYMPYTHDDLAQASSWLGLHKAALGFAFFAGHCEPDKRNHVLTSADSPFSFSFFFLSLWGPVCTQRLRDCELGWVEAIVIVAADTRLTLYQSPWWRSIRENDTSALISRCPRSQQSIEQISDCPKFSGVIRACVLVDSPKSTEK